MNIEQLKEFVCLDKRKKDLDAELKQTNQRIAELEEALIPQFVEDGVDRMTIDSRTIYLLQKVSASPLNSREDVIDALKQSELGQYVAENYNTQSLTAFVNEIRKDLEARFEKENRPLTEEDVRAALPAPLGRALKITLFHKLGNRTNH
jgi:uncharacterized protein YeeX (DUF496 family)